jgi:2,4-dichlorophenol 6-monooxygenase
MPNATTETQVLIVGGGAAGLTSSILLGQLGVDSLLVERHPGTSLVPKAHIIHCRTLEIFQQLGLELDVRIAGTPAENFTHTSWYTSLGGDEPWDRKVLLRLPSWSYADLAPYYVELTASPMANLPQHLLEPVLRQRAEKDSGPESVRFNHELTALAQDEDGVLATIMDRASGVPFDVRARYVIVADAGKTVGPMLGVRLIGPEPFVDVVSLTFRADLSAYLQDDDSVIRLFLQPAPDGTVRRFSVVAAGPDVWDRHCTHWRSGVILPAGSEQHPQSYTEQDAIRDLRGLLKLPDLEITEISMNHWLIESVVADRFQVGSAFFVGDAAHRHSPMGGLGLNTGIQDAHNLAWKLAAVLAGQGSSGLLASYEAERRPVAQRRVEFATFSFFNHLSVSGGFGMLPGASEEHNRAVLEALFSETPDGATRRSQLEEMIFTLRREFQHADLDLGFEYGDSAAVIPDGTDPPPRDPTGHRYHPVARPGHRLPHAWLERDGELVATHHLLRPGRFLLLAGAAGSLWLEAAAASEVPISAYLIDAASDLRDRDGAWSSLRGHEEDGALLVRPDGHVAFRAFSMPDDPAAALQAALDGVLGTRVTADAGSGGR